MTYEIIPRELADPRQHTHIDTELKLLKLASRRLQQSSTVLTAEQQLLQRLYYKNKNQHRGALFWRNVGELLRYLRKIDDYALPDSVLKLRNTFYGAEDGSNSMKGPWTHYPNQIYLKSCSSQFKIVIQLLIKLSVVCIKAYGSFYRSMQSGSFLQIHLMFVAISSRLRSLALDLQKVMEDIKSCTDKLHDALFTEPQHMQINLPNSAYTSTAAQENATSVPANKIVPSTDSSLTGLVGGTLPLLNKSRERVTFDKIPVIRVEPVIERKVQKVTKVSKLVTKDTNSRKSPNNLSEPKKKKRRVSSRDEIDDIFGF